MDVRRIKMAMVEVSPLEERILLRAILPSRVLDALFHGFITALFERTCEKLRVL
jgi:hypothetical protein